MSEIAGKIHDMGDREFDVRKLVAELACRMTEAYSSTKPAPKPYETFESVFDVVLKKLSGD